MRIKTRMMLALGCVSLLAASIPAFSQPLPQPRPSVAKKQTPSQTAAQENRRARLVSMRIDQPPKQPPLGWPALVREARKYMGTNPTNRSRLWCATFMNMVLAKTGYAGTNSDAAKSFAQYGRRISEPKVGAIAVLTRGKNGGHVGVVSGIDANGNPIIISGNHGRRVGEAIYPRARVIAYVMPSERRAGPTQLADRNAPNRSTPDTGLDSPIAELIAAIQAEQARPERPSPQLQRPERSPQVAQPAPPPSVPQLTVQQTAEQGVQSRRDLPLEPGLAEFLGIRERAQIAPRTIAPREPQREQRVEQQPSGRVAVETGLAGYLGLPQSR